MLIKGKKICGILQEIINKQNQKFLILGIGINLIKNPIISNYPTTNLNDLINKKISKRNIEIQLKIFNCISIFLFEIFLLIKSFKLVVG